MSDLCTLIESRLETAREKVAEENAAEKEARSHKKEKMPGSDNKPKTSKGVPGDMGYPKVSGPIKSSDLRKVAEEIEAAIEEEKNHAEHVVKLASDLAIEAAALDIEEQQDDIKKAWGPLPTKDMEELAKKTAAISMGPLVDRFKNVGGAALEELGLKARTNVDNTLGAQIKNKLKQLGTDPAEQAAHREILESRLPPTLAPFAIAARKSISDRAQPIMDEAVGGIEDRVRGGLSALTGPAPQPSNVSRNLSLLGGAGAAAGAGYLGHRSGVRSEQAKDPAQIRAAYGLGWQRAKQSSDEGKVASLLSRNPGVVGSALNKAKELLGISSPSNMKRNLALGAGGLGLAGAGGAVGHQVGYGSGMEEGIASEQAKDP